MSRPIEYRAWDCNRERYLGRISRIEYDLAGQFYGVEGEDSATRSDVRLLYDSVILEQYTGLIDKNGEKIYEGDIVEQFVCGIHQFKGKKCGRRTIWEVRWNKKECCFELHYLSGSLFGDSMMSDGDEYEVIGNVHKNKGLLGGEE